MAWFIKFYIHCGRLCTPCGEIGKSCGIVIGGICYQPKSLNTLQVNHSNLYNRIFNVGVDRPAMVMVFELNFMLKVSVLREKKFQLNQQSICHVLYFSPDLACFP